MTHFGALIITNSIRLEPWILSCIGGSCDTGRSFEVHRIRPAEDRPRRRSSKEWRLHLFMFFPANVVPVTVAVFISSKRFLNGRLQSSLPAQPQNTSPTKSWISRIERSCVCNQGKPCRHTGRRRSSMQRTVVLPLLLAAAAAVSRVLSCITVTQTFALAAAAAAARCCLRDPPYERTGGQAGGRRGQLLRWWDE